MGVVGVVWFIFVCLSGLLPVFCVIGVVAPLTESAEVRRVAVFGGMVEVCNREDYLNLFACFGVEPQDVIFNPAELAPVVSPL